MTENRNDVKQGAGLSDCPACATPVKTGAKFCAKCGADLRATGEPAPPPAVAAKPVSDIFPESPTRSPDKTSWRSGLDFAKAAAVAAQAKGTELTGDAIEQHWPVIQKVLREQIAPMAMAAATNDELVETIARTLHGLLPLPIRLVIRPHRLTSWCMTNRDRILSAIRSSGMDPK
jgi:hypothetical protein